MELVMAEENVSQPSEYVTYQDGEYWLLAGQAAALISKNSGKPVDTRYLHHFVMQGRLHPRKMTARMNWYRWSEVRVIRVGEIPPGLKKQAEPSPTALYQRELKRRKQEGTFVPRRSRKGDSPDDKPRT